MSGVHLANPAWAHALWLVLGFAAVLLLCERRGSAVLDRLLSPLMQRRLVSRPSPTRRVLRCALLGASCLFLVVALMRPQWGLYFERTPRAGTELMVCLDVSKSMLAEDVSPNRLERAKAEIADLLEYLEGDHVGLIAFAGKATVLCPLTPDFSFLRLVLDEAGPHSVARGGTSLAAPILQAVEGFGGAGDISRAVLLITDGEDHDAFAVEAAEKAAERGVKIFTVGFGSEEGSQIMITDPRTAARTVLTDADGTAVISRLDGETLRFVALATEGAYIPAGTGVLDLDSIYRDLLAPLTRGQLDGRGRAVRKEGFQWAVLVALIMLVGAVAATTGGPRAGLAQRRIAALIGLLLAAAAPAALAQDAAEAPPASAATAGEQDDAAGVAQAADPAEPQAADTPTIPEDSREAYNTGLTLLSSQRLEEAEAHLEAARRQAGADGTVRYRSTYNLGWLYVEQHDQVLESDPQQALQHLYTAASWFRDAVRLRPEEPDARHNLEVVMRKALALADALRQDSDRDLAARLDELIGQQREFLGQARTRTTQAQLATDPASQEAFRRDFRDMATAQRQILSDSGRLGDDAAEERDAIEAAAAEERTPEDQVRAAQLGALLHYLHEAGERLSQARRQLRQQRGERGRRRAAAGLRKMRRARDQLREPPEILRAIVTDTAETMQHTLTLAASTGLAGLQAATDPPSSDAPAAQAPPWLTPTYVGEAQGELAQRCEELHARLQAGLAGHDAEAPPPEQDPASQRTIDLLREALPFILEGRDAQRQAATFLETDELERAIAEQDQAIRSLVEALELFLDIRGLIEVIYQSHSQLQALLQAEQPQAGEALLQALPALGPATNKDLQRVARLQDLLEQELASMPQAEAPAQAPAPTMPGKNAQPAQEDPARQRLEIALQYLELLRPDMEDTRRIFRETARASGNGVGDEDDGSAGVEDGRPTGPDLARVPPETGSERPEIAHTGQTDAPQPAASDPVQDIMTRLVEARAPVQRTVSLLEELRRLFFSVIEHLRDTARRQEELLGDTAEAAAMGEEQARIQALGPLTPRQDGLSSIAGEIAQALEEQSRQPPVQPDPAGAEPPQQSPEDRERLARAAELVHAARDEMDAAVASLETEPPEVDAAQQHQHTALQQLLAALQTLQPPQQEQQQQDEQQQQQQGEQEQEQQQEDQQGQQQDLAQLLQAVRDREAQRRSERERGSTRYEPVDQDW